MTIEINDRTTIRDVQRQLRKSYPFLKIRFADRPHRFDEVMDDAHWYHSYVRLSEIATRFTPGIITIKPQDKVGDIEQLFPEQFGLYPQIFRTDGYRWIRTAGTGIISIDEQNEIGQKTIQKINGINGIQDIHLL